MREARQSVLNGVTQKMQIQAAAKVVPEYRECGPTPRNSVSFALALL